MTTTERVALEGAKRTLLLTVKARAIDARSKAPMLGDHWAADVMDRIDYPNKLEMRMVGGDRFTVILRAMRLDQWCRNFIAAHPDGTVLQLACGFDTRAFRVAPPASVRWYDLDFPDVIELRRKVVPAPEGEYHLIGSSVTEAGWLEQIPNDKPVLVVAEGLLMYVPEPEVRTLLDRLTSRFSEGELICDVMGRMNAKFSNRFGYNVWGLDDPTEFVRWNSRLTLLEGTSVYDDCEQIPVRGFRAMYGLVRKFKGIRNGIRPLRFRIGSADGAANGAAS